MVASVAAVRDRPPFGPKRLRLPEAEWLASLDAIQPTPSRRLIACVDGCSDLGVSWSLNKGLIVRMTVGATVLDVLGVQQDGLVEIPWSLGAEKDAFNGFARTLAAAIPGARSSTRRPSSGWSPRRPSSASTCWSCWTPRPLFAWPRDLPPFRARVA
jgi:hypothetical protein